MTPRTTALLTLLAVAACGNDTQITGKVIVERRDDTGEPEDEVEDADADAGADGDADGYTIEQGDCDDTDASVNPGAAEVWYDGVDADCDGLSDDDADRDGFDSDAHGCDDCDDTDPTVNPWSVDTWYGGVDSNCAGDSDYDADGDGHDADAYGGTDCDDTTARVSPGEPEIPENGIDDDCDPTTPAFSGTLDPTDATATWASSTALGTGGWGSGVAILDDIDADGIDAEIAIGARYARPHGTSLNDGAVYVFEGLGAGGTEADALSESLHTGMGGELGVRVRALDDLDGDGIGEVFLSAYSLWVDRWSATQIIGPGAWYIVSGADLVSGVDLSDRGRALAWGTGVEETQYFGFEGGHGDFDGDGVQDLFVTSAAQTRATSNEVVLFLSTSGSVPTGEQVIGASHSVGMEGDDADGRDRYGWHATANDVDGDGIDDMVIGAFEQDTCGAEDAGAVFVHLGPITAATTYASADGTLCMGTPAADANLGHHVSTGDFDDDGYPDIAGGAPDIGASLAGSAAVWLGGAAGTSPTPDGTFTAGETGDWFGHEVRLNGDLSGDGIPDLVVAARYAAISGSSDVGTVTIYEGGATIDTTADVVVELHGTAADLALLDVGDIDLDGVDDLLCNETVWLFGSRGWQE